MSTQRFLFIILLSTLFFASDCDQKEDPSHLDITFKSTYDGAPLVMFDQQYTYPGGTTPIKFQLFNVYISNITLFKGTANNPTEEYILSEVEILNFGEFFTTADAANGIQLNFQDIPFTNYSGIRLGIGVDPALNATQPGDYSALHPLSDNYWSAALGYVFTKIEANADLNGDGDFDDKLTYHIGKNDLYQTLAYQRDFIFSNGGDDGIEIEIDLYNMLTDGVESLDISDETLTQDHTNNPAVYDFLWENLLQTFELK